MRHRSTSLEKILKAFPTPSKRVSRVMDGGKASFDDQDVILRTRKIYWGIPCDELSFTMFWTRFEANSNKMPWDGFASSMGTYLPKARNFIHNGFLESNPDHTHLMMLDSDILFPPHIADRLLAHKLPIVGGWYRDKNADDYHPCVYDFLSEENGIVNWKHRGRAGIGLEKVDGMGAGCWLIRRDIAMKLGKNPYDLNSGGEDMKLCRMLMKMDIPLYVDWSINCAHVGVRYI